MKWDMTKVVEEIAMQAKENEEEFIFETIRPYCENILQMKINKEELNRIILRGVRSNGKWIEVNRGIHVTDYRCSECGRIVRDDTGYDVSADYPYCHCGAKMGGDSE